MTYIRIRKHYLHLPYVVLGSIEFIALFLVIYFARSLHQYLAYEPSQFMPALAFTLIMTLSSLAMGAYHSLAKENAINMILRTVVSFCLLGVIAYTVLQFFFSRFYLPSVLLFWSTMSSLLCVIIIRVLFVRLVDISQIKRRILIWGGDSQAADLFEIVEENQSSLSVVIAGFVNKGDRQPDMRFNMKSLSVDDNLNVFCAENHISEIVIAQQERRSSEGAGLPLVEMLNSKLSGIAITDLLSFYERELNKVNVGLVKASWMLFSDGFVHSKSRNFSKRIFDLCLSGLLVILFSPFMVLTAIAVFLESGAPVLYSQNRIGLNGKEFRIFKFRSMRQDAEKDGKARWATKNDSRITRVGAFIRNTRLDELPQLWNVLNGSMSFIGPRPERPEFVQELEKTIPYYAIRHKVKPGLMGWAQLKYPYGASAEDAKNKLEYDLYYTKNHSFFMDVIIVIQTVEVVLLGKGVH